MKHLLLVLSTSFACCSIAQSNFHCASQAPSTEALKKMKELTSSSSKTDEIRIIPVVFHVLHQYGSENISNAQILDEMQIINEDFQLLNADTINIQAPFDTIKGKVNFEFRLAHIDPNGNPTTGIDRIVTPLTNVGNESAMINMWDPAKYVNIWVVRNTIPGFSGFSINPLENNDYCQRGIVILHSYVGSIGTASPNAAFALTHEMGHFFGLFHTFGDTCGVSDGIYDTPYATNISSCNFNANTCNDSLYTDSFNYWGFDPRNMVENFMDYTWCSFMFTKGQAAMIRAIQEDPTYGRDQLSTEANLIATGTGPGPQTASLALPASDFTSETHTICTGASLELFYGTPSTTGITYAWSFPGGTPSTSTDANPAVTYANPGYYDISMTTTNSNGSSTTTINQAVYVSGNWAEFYGPNLQDFNADPIFWIPWNNNNDNFEFSRILNNGVDGTPCYVLNNELITDSALFCSPLTYQNNLEGKVDELISPAFELMYTSGITVSFDYAYASSETDIASMTEKLKVYSSSDCGDTWFLRKTLTDTALTTAFENTGTVFVPTALQWKHASFNYTPNAMDSKTRFKFEFTAENHSNYLYIDNFQIDGVLGLGETEYFNIAVHPNPIAKGGILYFDEWGDVETGTVQIIDLQGNVLIEKSLVNEYEMTLPDGISAGLYLVKVNGRTLQLMIE